MHLVIVIVIAILIPIVIGLTPVKSDGSLLFPIQKPPVYFDIHDTPTYKCNDGPNYILVDANEYFLCPWGTDMSCVCKPFGDDGETICEFFEFGLGEVLGVAGDPHLAD